MLNIAINTVIIVNNVISKYGQTVLEATIQDYKGNALSKKTIVLTIDNKNYIYGSDNEGKVLFNLNSLIPGDYIVNLKFEGDKIYANSSNSSTVTVNKLGTHINVDYYMSFEYGETVVIASAYAIAALRVDTCPSKRTTPLSNNESLRP